jgi:hypothetical protein
MLPRHRDRYRDFYARVLPMYLLLKPCQDHISSEAVDARLVRTQVNRKVWICQINIC